MEVSSNITRSETRDACGPLRKRHRLIYRAWLYHHPGFDELIRLYLARTQCGRFAALVLASDYEDPRERQEIDRMEAGKLSCKDLAKTLLKRLWEDERDHNDADGPAFHEIIPSKSAILNASEIRELESLVWPRTKD
jgi:hypothetical protein